MDRTQPFGKIAGELTAWPSSARAAGRLKWGDLVFKRGLAEVPPSSLGALRSGETFSIEVPAAANDHATLADLNAAVVQHRVLDLTLTAATSTALLGRCTKVEALAIKQKITEYGPVLEIQLRKL